MNENNHSKIVKEIAEEIIKLRVLNFKSNGISTQINRTLISLPIIMLLCEHFNVSAGISLILSFFLFSCCVLIINASYLISCRLFIPQNFINYVGKLKSRKDSSTIITSEFTLAFGYTNRYYLLVIGIFLVDLVTATFFYTTTPSFSLLLIVVGVSDVSVYFHTNTLWKRNRDINKNN